MAGKQQNKTKLGKIRGCLSLDYGGPIILEFSNSLQLYHVSGPGNQLHLNIPQNDGGRGGNVFKFNIKDLVEAAQES